MSGERILEVAADIRSKTSNPFARHLAPLVPYFDELRVPLPELPERFFPTHREQVEAVMEARPTAGVSR